MTELATNADFSIMFYMSSITPFHSRFDISARPTRNVSTLHIAQQSGSPCDLTHVAMAANSSGNSSTL